MDTAHDLSETTAFDHLHAQIAALSSGGPETVTGGHRDLGADLWMSTDPAGHAAMTCRPAETGISLRLEAGDSGRWCCLGMRLPAETLARGRYLGLLVSVQSGDVLSFTPTLRFFHDDGGFQDVPAPAPVVLAGGAREHLSHVVLDPDRLAGATGCELNIFFHTDAFEADFLKIEPVLIL